MGPSGDLDAVREAVRAATEEAARAGRPFSVIDEWAKSRSALLLELWLAQS